MRNAEMPAPTHEMEAAAHPRRPREETARLGKEIYERDIRRQVEAGHHGEIVAIDVDSGTGISRDTRHGRDGPPASATPGCRRRLE